MALAFVNRTAEMAELDAAARRGGLLVLYGRRRVGKTRLLRHWLDGRGGMYSQAIEAQPELQLAQIVQDLAPHLDTQLVPRRWPELFELLSRLRRRWVLCLDELPYLTAADPSLPSQLQRWIDHDLPRGCTLVLAGSSVRMMHDLFLHRGAPLYGRARKLVQVEPMDYLAFCAACRRRPGDRDTFEMFACVGGIPRYWEFVEPRQDARALANALYFDFAPFMEHEPQRLLRDEGVAGLGPAGVLEAIGRGAERVSEIAARMGTAQTNLSRQLQQLLDASVLVRELPFGESARSSKKTLYRIQDPATRFWYRVYSPHRSLWPTYDAAHQRKLIHDHAATVFEDVVRASIPGAARYWAPGLELDLVAPDPEARDRLLVAEIKWRPVAAAERTALLRELEARWARSALRARHPRVRFEVIDASWLKRARTPSSSARPSPPG